MVAAGFDRGGAEDVVERSAVGLIVDPFADCVEHVAMEFALLVTHGGVVESAEDVFHDFVDGDSWVLPSVENTAGLVLVGE